MQQHYADYVNYLERGAIARFPTTRTKRITEIKTSHWKHFSVRVYCQMATEIMFSVLNIWLVSHIIVIIINIIIICNCFFLSRRFYIKPFSKYVKLTKQPIFRNPTGGFPAKWTSEKWGQKIPYWLHITTQIWVVHLIGCAPWEICFSQKVIVFWEFFHFFFLEVFMSDSITI